FRLDLRHNPANCFINKRAARDRAELIAGPEIIFNFGNNGANSSTTVPAPSSSDQQTGASSTQNSQTQKSFSIWRIAEYRKSILIWAALVLKFASQPSSSGSLNVIG